MHSAAAVAAGGGRAGELAASTEPHRPGYLGTMPKPEVVLITKADCHLCEAARDAVGRVTAELGLEWTEQLVDNQPDLREQYAEEIPVVLVDGIQRDFWKIDETRLARVLRQAMAK